MENPNAEKIKELLKMGDTAVDDFNAEFRTFITYIEDKFKDNANLYRLKQRLFLAMDADPTIVIKFLGPSLWFQREHILKRNEKHFLNIDYNNSFNDVDMNKVEKAAMNSFINLIKNDYVNLNPVEKDRVYLMFKCFLKNYTIYLKTEKDRIALGGK